jgi:arylsulfatase A-like enzyme
MASTPPTIMVLTILDDVHPSGVGPYNVFPGGTHPETSPDDWATPELVDMAAAGIRLNNFRTEMSCTPTRSEIHGYGAVGRASNLNGRAFKVTVPNGINIDTTAAGGANLVRTFKKLGYTVAGFGKLHLSNEQPVNFSKYTWAKQMGFDHYGAMMVSGGPSRPLGCGSTIRPNIDDAAWGHNWWCEYALDGTYQITGDGTSDAGVDNGYSNQVIFDAAKAYIELAIDDSPNKYLIIISSSGPHTPWEDGDDITVDYADDDVADEFVDDRIPGGSASNAASDNPVYGEQLIHLDGLVGEINDVLADEAGLEYMHIVVGDNGVPSAVAGALCDGSRGTKKTPYPCGTNTPFVIQGTALGGVGGEEIDALFGAVDLPKTMARLAGGNHGRRDGISFADCLTYENSKTAANCVGNEVLVSHTWEPLGGDSGTNTAAPKDGDDAAEWTSHELGAIADACGGKTFMLNRQYNTSAVHGPFCEAMYEITSALVDPYIATANAAINLVDSSTCFSIGGDGYEGELDQGVMDADETCAYLIMRDAIQARATVTTPAPFLSGGSM